MINRETAALTTTFGDSLYEQAALACQPETDSYFGRPDIQASIVEDYVERSYPSLSAVERIHSFVDHTPLQAAPLISQEAGVTVLLKREDLQDDHSFKRRGAANKMLQLTAAEQAAGVVTVSAGNHAQGVASMAQKMGIPSTIFMPATTPQVKVDAVKNYGATIVLRGDSYSDAYTASQQVLADSPATFIHAFDDPDVIAGQGTVGLEIMADDPTVTDIIVPIGGGGLAAGVGQAVKAIRPDIRVIGVQYEDSDAMARSLEAGELTPLKQVGIFSDGTAVMQPGAHTYELINKYVDEVIRVSEDDIILAIDSLYRQTRTYLEPAGALALAGAKKLAAAQPDTSRRLAVVCSGGNISIDKTSYVVERAALLQGRRSLMSIRLPEQPGALRTLCRTVLGSHNINRFTYTYNGTAEADILIGLNLASAVDKEKVTAVLDEHSYQFVDHSANSYEVEHARHMVGGPSHLSADQELNFRVNFPERPGALLKFLDTLDDDWNITRFDYQNSGGESSNVFISFAAAGAAVRGQLLERLAQTGYITEQLIPADLQRFIARSLVALA